jgi:hypothetical protein
MSTSLHPAHDAGRGAVADRLASAVVEAARLRASAPGAAVTRAEALAARRHLLELEHHLRAGRSLPGTAELRVMDVLDHVDGSAYGPGGAQ